MTLSEVLGAVGSFQHLDSSGDLRALLTVTDRWKIHE